MKNATLPTRFNKYIPENFDYDKLIEQYPPTFKMDKERLLHIVSLLNEIPAKAKNKYKDNDGWVPLNSTLIQRQGIRFFPLYRDWLLEAGVIEVNMQFFRREKSRRFRFTPEYKTPVTVVVINRTTLVKALAKAQKKEDEYSRYNYKHLFRWFDGLEIDAVEARKYLRSEYEKEVTSDEAKTRAKAMDRFNSGLLHLDKMESKEWHFKTDMKAGRLHHNLTNMKSGLRNFVTWKGQKLVSLDIRNSQPVMSVALLNPKFWMMEDETEDETVEEDESQGLPSENFEKIGKNLTLRAFFPLFSSISLTIQDLPSYLHPHHLHERTPLKLAVLDQPDVIQYIQWVAAGQLYEEIERLLLERGEIKTHFTSRRELKIMMFVVLFTSNRFLQQVEAEPKRLFKDIFPSVYEVFKYCKRSDKVDLPLLLQKIESILILDKVAKRISKERRELPIFTIHDSVVTTLGNEDYVMGILKEEVCKMIGIMPQVTEEKWVADNLIDK